MNFLKKINHYIFKQDFEFKVFLLKYFFYAMLVRFLMLFVKYKRYERYLGKRGAVDHYTLSDKEYQLIEKMKTAVNGLSTHTPWESKCMVQALSVKWMLHKYKIPSTIYFGVKKDPKEANRMKAHAWLKVGDIVVSGGPGHQTFKVVNFYS